MRAEHVGARVSFQDDVLDAVGVKQLPKQQLCRISAYDCYFCPQYLFSRCYTLELTGSRAAIVSLQ